MKSSVSSCPVPFEQQPLNEYQELKESWFFRWAMLDLPQYIRKLLWIWGWSWLIAGPIAAASFPPAKYPAQFALTGMAGAALFLLLVLIRLYLGWTYIRSRLSNATIFYEESGWYDGQLWEKPPEMLVQDRLVVTYQIQPILKRLTQTFGVLAIMSTVGALVWQVL
ncbi:MAG: CGLD27 family protein [Leptolyngbya sp. BL-A-14]